jgi:hypothetical protein
MLPAPASAKVSMAIKNLTGVDRTILFTRFADTDFSRGGADDDQNDFDFTIDTAMGLEPSFRTGLSLTNNNFTFAYEAFTQPTFTGPDPCGPFNVATQPFFGDGSLVQLYQVVVPKLATKTINLTYKPFNTTMRSAGLAPDSFESRAALLLLTSRSMVRFESA